jgi:tRNA(Ile)-lysidine synthase
MHSFRPPEPGQKILVAVSGGVDSMVLLHLLKKLSTASRWDLTVVHFNHQLRGKASDSDETFVRKAAAAMKLPFVVERADVKKFAKESKLSIEMAARKLRHEFLARVARQRKIKTIALAHHADDQVELFFLRLLRGAAGGLAGMKWQSPSPADKKVTLIRPLLDISKTELDQFARGNKIRFREDATNASPDFLRNRIRHQLLPLLRSKYQPALNKVVLRLMEITGAESELADDTVRLWISGKRSSGIEKNFAKLPVAIQRRILNLQLHSLGIAVDFDLIESLRTSVHRPIVVSTNISVFRDQKGRVQVREHQTPKFNDGCIAIKINKSGNAAFAGVKLKWQFKRPGGKGFALPTHKTGTEYFNADKIRNELVLRHWRAGDRFQPIGLKSPAKLQDLFTNQKIPQAQRHRLIVAESDGEIFWVEGLRIAENFKLTPQTKRRLVWQWRR